MENKENTATAIGRNLPISTKQSIEICAYIRGKKLTVAKKILQDVIVKKRAIPFRRFNKDLAHKSGMAAGRYPEKSSKYILDLLEGVEANAQFKGLDTSNTIIKSIIANKAQTPWHSGRRRGIKMRRTHVGVVVIELSKKEEKDNKKDKK